MKRLLLSFLVNVFFVFVGWPQINFGPARPGPEGSVVRPFAADSLGNLYTGGTGIFRSTNGGDSWVRINPDLSPNCLLINRSGHIFAGIGNGGLFRSTNGGSSWEQVGMGIIGQSILSLTLDPLGNIYAGTNYGLYFSTNNGSSFVQKANLPPNSVNDLDVNTDGTLFAATNSGIFSSPDLGASWTHIQSGFVNVSALKKAGNGNYFASCDQGVFRSSDRCSTWVNSLLRYDATYLVIVNGTDLFCSTYSSGVFRSTNSGQSWEPVNTGLNQGNIISMFVRPNGDLFAGTFLGPYRSTDGGSHWTPQTSGLGQLRIDGFVIAPSGNLFAGGYGGVFRSSDGGIAWEIVNKGFGFTDVWFLDVAPSGVLFAGTSNGAYRSTNAGGDWTLMTNGLQTEIPSAIGFLHSGAILLSTSSGVYRTTDNGDSWSRVFQDFNFGAVTRFGPDSAGNVYAVHGPRILASTDDGVTWNERSRDVPSLRGLTTNSVGHLLATGQGGVFRSLNGGLQWEQVHTAPAGSNDLRLTINDAGFVYLENDGGQISQSKDNGKSWTVANSGLAEGISKILLDPAGYMYALTPQNTIRQSVASTVQGTAPNIFVSPLSLGRQRIAQTHDSVMTVCNIGNGILNVSSVAVSDTMLRLKDPAFAVPPHAKYIDSLHITPRSLGSRLADIVLSHNSETLNDTVHVNFFGFGVPKIRFSVDTLRFGRLDFGDARDSVITGLNEGDDTLAISMALSTSISFTNRPIYENVLPGGSFTDTVRFSPRAAGRINGHLVVQSNTESRNDSLPLSGAGTDAQIQLPMGTIYFPTLTLGQKRDTVVTIRNLGTDTLRTRSITTPASFKSHPVSWTIPPGQSIDDTITFEPQSYGYISGPMFINFNGISSPAMIYLYGQALDNKLLVVRPSSLKFGVVRIGDSSSASITLLNAGADTIRFFNPGVPSHYRIAALPQKLAPGDSSIVSVIFKPLTFGYLNSTLLIYNNTSRSPAQIILHGTCADSARYSFASKVIAFPTIVAGTSRDTVIVVSNTGPDTLRLLSVFSSSPSWFSYRPSSAKIPPYGSSTDTIRFFGDTPGPASGFFNLFNNSPITPETLYVSGTVKGVAKLSIASRELDFGDVEIESSKDAVLSIANTGEDTLRIFSVVSVNPVVAPLRTQLVIPPSQAFLDTIRFSPAVAESLSNAFLVLTHNASGSPDTVRVRGKGLPIFWRIVSNPGPLATRMIVTRQGNFFVSVLGQGISRSTDNGVSWVQVNNGLSGSPFVTSVQGLAISDNGTLFAATVQDGVFRSTDNGTTWEKKSNGLTSLFVNNVYVNGAGVAFAATNTSFGDSNGVFRSLNNGDTWALLDIGLRNPNVFGMGGTSHGETFVAALDHGIYRSTDNGGTWSLVATAPSAASAWNFAEITSGEIFAATDGNGILRSTDHGLSWSSTNTGLHSLHVFCLVGAKDGSVFAGSTREGVLRSTDRGNSWFKYNNGSRDTVVWGLVRHPSDYIYVLNMTGLFRSLSPIVTSVSDKDAPQRTPPTEYALEQNYPNPFNPSTTIRFSMAGDAHVSVTVFDLLGRQVEMLVDQRLAAGRYTVQWSPRQVSSGIYLVRMHTESYKAVKKVIYLK